MPASEVQPRITRLRLSDFRSYASLDIAPDAPLVALCGPNGAGKTNILEAISLFTPGRGLRRATGAMIACRGGAGGYAVLADLVVAAEGARWTHVFARRGMVPHAGDPFFMPRVLSFHRLNEAMLLSDTITSETLAEWGCVNRLVPADQVDAVAGELATRIAAGPTRSLSISKQMYRRSLTNSMETMFYEEADATALVTNTTDRYEGVKSLMENRPPDFTGN